MLRLTPFFVLIGCGSPHHLQYDHGRASAQAFGTQGQLDRPEVADDAYEALPQTKVALALGES